jgi:hypothetical protein
MLDPLDGFLGLHPSKASFLDERLGLLRRAHHNRLAIRHCRTPATERGAARLLPLTPIELVVEGSGHGLSTHKMLTRNRA